jgi:hypothetical protein
MKTNRRNSNKVITAVMGCVVVLGGCAGGRGSVSGHGTALDQSTHALAGADLLSANGTYGASCQGHISGSHWSVEIAAGATLDYTALTVLQGDSACALTLTALRTSGGLLTGSPSITMTGSYQTTASAFGSAVYANARLSATSFNSDFTVQIVYSDDPATANGNNTANYGVSTSSASASAVPSPDDTLDVTGITIQTNVSNVVPAVGGSAELTGVTTYGQTYVVVESSGLTTYAALDEAYLAGTPAMLAFDATTHIAPIAASAFTMSAVDLSSPAIRTLIVANTANGLRSYEAFEITFNHP